MSRSITLHESATCNLTTRAELILTLLNLYKYNKPSSTFTDMARWFNANYAKTFGYISTMTLSRYYYGYHSVNNNYNGAHKGRGCFNQVRRGASTPLTPGQLITKSTELLRSYYLS